MNQKNKNNKTPLGFFFVFLSIVLLFLAYSYQDQKQSSNQLRQHKPIPHLERVNEHLSMTYLKKSLSEAKIEAENKKLTPIIDSPKNFDSSDIHANSGLDLSSDNRSELLTENLGRGMKTFAMPINPKEVIYTDLFNQDQDREYSVAYKEAYAKQFIENAKRSGYIIKLDSNYKIISVTPIQNPSNEGPTLNELSRSPSGEINK